MAAKDFTAVMNPQKTPASDKGALLNYFAKDAFTLPTLLLAGALLQVLFMAILPSRYALLPALATLLWSVITTVLQSVSSSKNNYLSDVIPGRVSAQLPLSNGSFGNKPAAHPVVVLNIGVRFNHPLGTLSPGAKETGDYFFNMIKQLRERADEFGYLGSTDWRANERSTQNTLLNIMYFRSVEGLNAFAHDTPHLEAWNFYNDFTKKQRYKHIGVFHETFSVGPGSYETIYCNMPPVLLGDTNFKVENEDTGAEGWIKPLVNADITPLKSQYGRMGRASE